MTLANYLTIIRLIISPIFMLVYIEHDYLGISALYLPYVLLFLMIISELSDAFDGYFARKFNQVTDLGKVLDPMADSISRIGVFLTFTLPPVSLPVPLVFVFIYRDSVVSTLRTVCALRGFALAARRSGKIKAVIQAVVAFMILLMMIPHATGEFSTLSLQRASAWLVSLAAVYTIYSAVDYILINRHYIYKLLNTHHTQSS